MLKLLYNFLLAFCLFTLFWTEKSSAQLQQKIIAQYENAKSIAPREKLYVHFDKSIYAVADTIWFKAYLTNNLGTGANPVSEVVYVELFNAKGERLNSTALPTVLGLTWGAFALNVEDYQPGNYIFRAYTQWMRNFGEAGFFTKQISILPSTVLSATSIDVKSGGSITKSIRSGASSVQDIDFQFLPEGGTWVAGITQKMAFKAISLSGKGIAVAGVVVDSKQQKIAEFKSNSKGMGYFNLVPLKGETYQVKLLINGFEFVKTLPKAALNGTTLHVDLEQNADSLEILVSSNLVGEELTILGQSKGLLCFTATLRTMLGKKTLKVTKDVFPTGVSQIMVLNSDGEVLNERNFFLNFNDQLSLKLGTPNAVYSKRDSIPLRLKVVDSEEVPVSGSFSVAITDDGQVAKDSVNDASILSYLLMTSDLKGEIENPGYYFHQPNAQTRNELDALMLTQGWVSYDWTTTKPLPFKAEKEFTISGKIDNLLNKPIAQAKVVLAGQNKSFLVRDTISNSQGKFVFDKLPVLDSASFVIQARNAKNKEGTLAITLNEVERPAFTSQSKKNEIQDLLRDSISAEYITAKNKADEFGVRSGIILKEVNITGKRVIKGSKNLNGPGKASQLISEKEIAPLAKRTLYDVLLERVQGFRDGVRSDKKTRDFYVHTKMVRFVIDGYSLDLFYDPSGGTLGYISSSPIEDDATEIYKYQQYIKSYLDYFKAEDIKGIEVMKESYSNRYQNNFANVKVSFANINNNYNFIEITTKTGLGPFLKKAANMYLLKPMNYGNNKVFYHPKYTTSNKTDPKPDFRSTLYWNPNVVTKNDGTIDLSFFASDRKGTYTVWIEGMDMQGRVGMKTMRLKIN